jgi:hypothetical protein
LLFVGSRIHAVRRNWWGVVFVLALGPLGVLAHQAALWASAAAVSYAVSLSTVRDAVISAAQDRVYAQLILGMLSSARVTGLELDQDSWLTVIFGTGSSVVGVHLDQLLVNLLMILTGATLLGLSRVGTGSRRWTRWLSSWQTRAVAVLSLAFGAGAELQLSWTDGSGGEMALSMVATKVLGVSSTTYDATIRQGLLLSLAINVLLISLFAVLGLAFSWLVSVLARRPQATPRVRFTRAQSALMVATSALAIGWCTQPAAAFEEADQTSAAVETPAITLQAAATELPSVVSVSPPDGQRGWTYWVNGQEEFIRGFGYNPVFDAETSAQRAERYDRDFEAMSQNGANTIVGWNEQVFDDVLMKKAADHGLGVILPFDLPVTVAYEDPEVRAELLPIITRRVEQFRNSPSLRMWGLGNEVLHGILWAKGSQERYQAAARFIVQAADVVHELDPNHPVVYRDAEDFYEAAMAGALAADGQPRPWFVYSMNFFTTRLQQAVDSGPTTSLPHALMVSEYGPVGMRPEDRPGGYRELWDIIHTHKGRMLGGLAYVWTTAGPEPLDRNFGLTDVDGTPVDGALAALGRAYHQSEKEDS